MLFVNEIRNEIVRRRDMPDVFTFTLDPADAKDFDDALSFEVVPTPDNVLWTATGCPIGQSPSPVKGGEEKLYQIGVHIADVSFYVKPGTKIDDEAYQRGTSVYLVDRVLPMLPEELCNDKCSLRPNEDKLCMSVVFTMDADARVLKYKICRTVIRSDVRLNYDEAQEMIHNSQCTMHNAQLHEALLTLNALAQKLRAERIANGALTIEQDEIRFRLDRQGHPAEIYFEHPNEAHHLIEEFMLLANRTVAKAVGSGRPFVYRVHDLPDADKLNEVENFKKKMKAERGRGKGSRFAGQSQEGLRRAIDMLTIRAQAKAVYSTYNIGHYGLAFSHYTHFTSPIRRYPDLMVHRLVEMYCLSAKRSFSKAVFQQSGLSAQAVAREQLELMCEHCSACEQEAAQAERDSIKLFQAIWMTDHIGEVLTGYISGITDFGLFVQLDESRCEGLIHISKIGDITRYNLGDAVTVRVVKTDPNRAQIDFEFA